MIKILKASAGSGKTYTLANSYIQLLLDNPDDFAYRHILAVTFTNKATAEMKQRILKFLYELSTSNKPEDLKYKDKAARILSNILHDYSAFAISTIDKFFQQTLRAFAREIGQVASYQIELDKTEIVNQAVDEILDGLDENNKDDEGLINFILSNMQESVEEGKAPHIEDGLKAMALNLEKEELKEMLKSLNVSAEECYSEEFLKALKTSCNKVSSDFVQGLKDRAAGLLSGASSIGLQPADFSRGWFAALEKYASAPLTAKPVPFTDAFRRKAEDTSEWFKKADADKLPRAEEVLLQPLRDIIAFWDSQFPLYNTACMMRNNIYGLGVAARLSTTFRRILKEKNVLCLDESNSILRDIIDGSDAPFVYEKVGTRIDHYLLDEFQDTSHTQWDNFLPLLGESDSRDGSADKMGNLIVGDIKQSIYRWRGSDWHLLAKEVQASFPRSVTQPLDSNYRSFEEIINFNNDFYPYAAATIDSMLGNASDGIRVADIYNDVFQTVGKDKQKGKGYIKFSFPIEEDAQLDEVVATIRDAHDTHKLSYGDIAVLVRTNAKGTLVAQRLIDEKIPVETEDSLQIKNSITVRRLVSLMSYVDNPSNEVGSYLAQTLGICSAETPTSYHSLTDLCDELYNRLYSNEQFRDACDSEVTYVAAFADVLMDYCSREGNELRDFLRYWDDHDPKISSPLGSDSVKILSIHKSKGLDFPLVILPFVEDIELYHTKTFKWCIPDIKDNALAEVGNRPYFVQLSGSAENSSFMSNLFKERVNQYIDAINMMYVATTRASGAMHLIGCANEKSCNELDMSNLDKISNFADILYSYCVSHGDFRELGDAASAYSAILARKEEEKEELPCADSMNYSVYPLAGRLGVRPYAGDFFEDTDNSLWNLSYRERGIVLHDILSRIGDNPSALEQAVDAAVDEGSLSSTSRDKVISFLRRRIESHPEFFPSGSCRVLCEMTLIDASGEQKRPDRVLIFPDRSVKVIDYKFGKPSDDYQAQISGYRNIFRSMGYDKVSACLWYVYQDEVVQELIA